MTVTDPRLEQIGDALQSAIDRELSAAPRRDHAGATRRRVPRRVTVGLLAAAVIIPAGAVAATQLLSNGDVAQSIPAGTLALMGTQPTCTTVTADVEYHCTLAALPSENGGPEPGQWQGTVEPTVDAGKHVNGGCRSLNEAGTEWECYIGQKAVSEQIIGPNFLGAYAPTPGVG